MQNETLIRQHPLQWLLDGDASICYQVYRDLMDTEHPEIRSAIGTSGWGKAILERQKQNGHWGEGFYNPKWTSSHYTLLDLKNLGIDPSIPEIRKTIAMILRDEKGGDGGINPAGTIKSSDLCINGMALNYCSYFRAGQSSLESIIDFILCWQMKDGGFNCQSNRKGAVHGSLHTTLSVAEGLWEYRKNGYGYRLDEVMAAEQAAREFMLMHRLFKSDNTGKIIHKSFIRMVYPPRWKYDILRALDYLQDSGAPYDSRMEDAIQILWNKRNPDMTWNDQARHPGKIHFSMEQAGKPGRWNTLRALRVLKAFGNRET